MYITYRTLLKPVRSPTREIRILAVLLVVVLFISILRRFELQQLSSSVKFELFHRENITDAFVYIWPDSLDRSLNRTTNQIRFLEDYARRTRGTVRSTKSILIVGTFYWDLGEAQRAFVTDKCPIAECSLTVDADRYRRTVDAIIILNMNDKQLATFLPKPAHQIWIANHWESPFHNGINTVNMKHYINWSSSYRHDSHIVTPYGHVEKPPSVPLSGSNYFPLSKLWPTTNLAASKTKQVAWFVSNCNDKNGRMNYASALSRHIKVDIYGSCGNMMCLRSEERTCFDLLRKDYKFYLSFENSNCDYYMTEKLFVNALEHNVIPIVMGARPEDYAAALPPHSYIHVDDFRSPRELADYLHKLDADDSLYNEYFRWKTEYTLANHSYWCRLCGLLHVAAEQRYVHWYTDYTRWWDGDRLSSCNSPWTKRSGVSYRTWRAD